MGSNHACRMRIDSMHNTVWVSYCEHNTVSCEMQGTQHARTEKVAERTSHVIAVRYDMRREHPGTCGRKRGHAPVLLVHMQQCGDSIRSAEQ